MRLSYQYRVLPTQAQKLKLNHVLRLCQYLYNRMLGERLDWWDRNRCYIDRCPLICHLPELKSNPNYYSQKALLPLLKQDLILVKWSGELIDLSVVYSQVLQDVVRRVDLAMQRTIRGDKNGLRSSKPRFKSESSYKSFIYTQASFDWVDEKYISLPKFGDVKVIWHRPLPDGFKVKTCAVSKKSDGWYITLTLEDEEVPTITPDEIVPTWDNSVGLDAVLHERTFLATSEKELIPARKAYRKNENKLQKTSRRKSAKKKGSRARRKLAQREARVHQKIARDRRNHHFQTAYRLTETRLEKMGWAASPQINQWATPTRQKASPQPQRGKTAPHFFVAPLVTKTPKKVFFVEDLDLKNLTKRNQAKLDEKGTYVSNGQSAKSGLNKSFQDAGFGQFVDILTHIVEKTGGRVIKVNPNYTSQICCGCDNHVPKELSDRVHHCDKCLIVLDRDINAAINIKRVGLDVFPTIKRCKGKLIVKSRTSNSTSKEIPEVTGSLRRTERSA